MHFTCNIYWNPQSTQLVPFKSYNWSYEKPHILHNKYHVSSLCTINFNTRIISFRTSQPLGSSRVHDQLHQTAAINPYYKMDSSKNSFIPPIPSNSLLRTSFTSLVCSFFLQMFQFKIRMHTFCHYFFQYPTHYRHLFSISVLALSCFCKYPFPCVECPLECYIFFLCTSKR